MASLHWCQDRFETFPDDREDRDDAELEPEETPRCLCAQRTKGCPRCTWSQAAEAGNLLRAAGALGLDRRLLVGTLLDLLSAELAPAVPAAHAAVAVCREFIAGRPSMADVERAEAAMDAEKTDCIVQTACQILQDWPTDAEGVGCWLMDAVTESCGVARRIALGKVVRDRLTAHVNAALCTQEVSRAA